MNTPKHDTKISFLSGISSLFEHARNGRIDIAAEILLDLKGKLSLLPPEFAGRQKKFLNKIEEQYALGRAGTSLESNPTLQDKVAQKFKPGVSLVAACMNRQQNLLKVLPTWLATEADEIIIVDWSSRDELWPMLENFNDSRLKVIRIDDEPRWILTHALNVGLREAQHQIIYKFDADISVTPNFISKNQIHPGEFIRGFWKLAVDAGMEDQKYVNGSFGAFKKDLMAIGFYDERIMTYGWDDSDIYTRLCMDLGLAARLLDQSTVRHIEQEEFQRTENQDVDHHKFLGRFGPTELEGAKNKFYTQLAGAWGPYGSAQRFDLKNIQDRLRRGRRVTASIPSQGSLRHLAEVFAIRQFSLWAANFPHSIGIDSPIGLELSRILRDAHILGNSSQLLAALQTGRNIHFVRTPQGPLRTALLKTLSLLTTHQQCVADNFFIIEMEVDLEAAPGNSTNLPNVFGASGSLIETMAEAYESCRFATVMALEEVFLGDVPVSRLIILDRETLRDEVIAKADRFVEQLTPRFANEIVPQPGTCLVTSLYDEQNLIRRVEYLCCIVLNLRVFERIILSYESRDGSLQDLLCLLSDRLQIPVGRLLVTPFNKRPTFEELFSIKAGLPDGTVLAVANADIVFDQSFRRIDHQGLLDTNMAVLSRWDVSDSGRSATLIKLENGSPNTFSADAWIVRTPFEPDFYLDYPIGTMHCDSFINNQLSLSRRYNIVNPCFDVRVYHLHDERFNSSEEKQVRDAAEIQVKYGIERARNGNQDPVKGVGWCAVSDATLVSPQLRFQCWRPKALIVDLTSGCLGFGHLLLFHALCPVIDATPDTVLVIRLREVDAQGTIGRLLCYYQSHFAVTCLVLDIEEREFDAVAASDRKILTRTVSFVDAIGWMESEAPGAWQACTHALIEWPKIAGLLMVRGEICGQIEPDQVLLLITAMHLNAPNLIDSLISFHNVLPRFSPEHGMLMPFVTDLSLASKPCNAGEMNGPRVSFITSMFRGAELLPGYLDNVMMAARLANGEVIIVDANPDDSDGIVVKNYLSSHLDAASLIRYIHLDHDPGLYNCWRIAIEQARAPLISNANLDDKRSPFHTARLVDLLERHPEYAGACGSIACIHSEPESDWYRLIDNQIWFFGEGSREICFEDLYRTDDSGEILSRNVMHCVPVWRKSLHDKHGFFDEEKYGTSADWAFWLHCTKAGERFYFEEEAFGRYFLNPESHNRRNDAEGVKERRIIENYLGLQQNRVVKQ